LKNDQAWALKDDRGRFRRWTSHGTIRLYPSKREARLAIPFFEEHKLRPVLVRIVEDRR